MIHGTNQARPLPQERVTRAELYNRQLRDRQLQKGFKVPSLVPGGLVVCVGSGPSLEREDIEYVQAKGVAIIAVNDAYTLAPSALALMASDSAWWIHKKPEFAGLRFALDPAAARVRDVHVLKNTGTDGIETDPGGLRTCRNSGGAAINLAVHFIGAAAGPRRILLLGYDMGADKKKTHFFGHHKFPLRDGSPYDLFCESFKKQVAPLEQLGIEVINCSRRTALSCFRRQPLLQALP